MGEARLREGGSCTAWAIGSVHTDDYCSHDGNPWIKSGVASFLLDGHHKMYAAARAGLPLGLLLFVPRSTRTFASFEACACGGGAEIVPRPLCIDKFGISLLSSLAGLSPEAYSAFSPPNDIILDLGGDGCSSWRRFPQSACLRDLLRLIVEETHYKCLGPTEYLEGDLWSEWPPSRLLLDTSLTDLGVADGWQLGEYELKCLAGWRNTSTEHEIWEVDDCLETVAGLSRKMFEMGAQPKTKSNQRKTRELQQKLHDFRERHAVPLLIDKCEKLRPVSVASCGIQELLRSLDGGDDDFCITCNIPSRSDFLDMRKMLNESMLEGKVNDLFVKVHEMDEDFENRCEWTGRYKGLLKEAVPLLLPILEEAHLAIEARIGMTYEDATSRLEAAKRLQCGLCRALEAH